MKLIEMKNVDKVFPGPKKSFVKVLDKVDFHVESGEIVSVVGESGCGKTTLGKLITDIYKPSAGQILFEGTDLKTLAKDRKAYFKYRLAVQMIHQDSYAALNPNKTILHSMSAPLLQHKLVKDNHELVSTLEDILGEVGLNPPWQFLDKYPHQLSGGQRQRILLARALLLRPKLIVADEPVSMVDVSLRISLLDLMNRVKNKYGISFVYITHDLATARYISQNGRISIMYLGEIVEENFIEEALKNPKHPYSMRYSLPHRIHTRPSP
jgi:peptide/nickel transport system ATP-binding protein